MPKYASAEHFNEAKEAARSIGENIFRDFGLDKEQYIREWLKNVYGEE